MSASTCPAGVADAAGAAGGLADVLADVFGEALAGTEADVTGLDAARREDGDADALGRAAGWVARSGGTVTVPRDDGEAAELVPRVRYRLPAIRAASMSRPHSRYLARGAGRAPGSR
jgi:hypothetical protein